MSSDPIALDDAVAKVIEIADEQWAKLAGSRWRKSEILLVAEDNLPVPLDYPAYTGLHYPGDLTCRMPGK